MISRAALAGLLLVASSCDLLDGDVGCPAIGCVGELELRLIDADGARPESFSGVISFGERTVRFACGVAGEPHDGDAACVGPGVVRFFGGAQEPGAVTLDVSAPTGSFQGPIEPDYVTEEDFAGEGCGDCTSASAEVELVADNSGSER